jgi:hypothetical protein
MCRNIRTLYNFDPPPTAAEIEAAALQYVRKISGFKKPSKINEVVFDNAIKEIANISEKLLNNLQTTSPPKNREIEAEKRRIKSKQRFGTN